MCNCIRVYGLVIAITGSQTKYCLDYSSFCYLWHTCSLRFLQWGYDYGHKTDPNTPDKVLWHGLSTAYIRT